MLSFIKKLFSSPKGKTSFEPGLVFSDTAKSFIKKRIEESNKPTVFTLGIQSDSKGNRRVVVGIQEPIDPGRVLLIDGIPTLFLRNSDEILDGSGVDLRGIEDILIYPGFDLSTQVTPNPQILRFISNKRILSYSSEISEGGWEKNDAFKKPVLVEKLFRKPYIESIFIEGYSIQIEISQKKKWKDCEEPVANTIIDYMEGLPDPIKIISKAD